MLADRRGVEERVEGGDALDIAGVEVQRRGDLAHRLGGEIAGLLLRQVEGRHHRGAHVRELLGQVADLLENVLRQSGHQRSTSPSTVSAVPMIAIMSATMWFIAIRSRGCRLTNEAARNFTRRGLCVPSLTT